MNFENEKNRYRGRSRPDGRGDGRRHERDAQDRGDRQAKPRKSVDDVLNGQPMTETESTFAMIGGGLLAFWALRKGGLFPTVAALAGGVLALAASRKRWPDVEAVSLDRWQDGGYSRRQERRLASERGWSDAAATHRSVVIHKPKDEVYAFWRDFNNLSRFMEHIERVEVLDEKRSRWVIKAPAGYAVEWEAVLTDDQPGERLAWTSAEGADVRNEGWVTFREEAGGTRVDAFIAYEPPGGQFGRLLAKIFGEEPSVQSAEDLNSLKRLLEAGHDTAAEPPHVNGTAAP